MDEMILQAVDEMKRMEEHEKASRELRYCMGVIMLNCKRFSESEWDYYSGAIEGATPHGIHNDIWREAMRGILALADD